MQICNTIWSQNIKLNILIVIIKIHPTGLHEHNILILIIKIHGNSLREHKFNRQEHCGMDRLEFEP